MEASGAAKSRCSGVDNQGVSGDVTGFIAGEVHGSVCDVLGKASNAEQ